MFAKALPALLCTLWFAMADFAPAAAFESNPRSWRDVPLRAVDEADRDVWVQFLDQYRRRRNSDLMPLRTDPGERQERRLEFRRQNRNRNQQREQDAAREAVRRGDILPLGGIIRAVRQQCPGRFLGAKLQRQRNGMSYRVRILRPSGQRIALLVDAKTGAVIGGRCG